MSDDATDQPVPPGPDTPPGGAPGAAGEGTAREPDDSPARSLVEDIEAYEVDPPPPGRARPQA